MTGRELIILILQNNMEDMVIFEDGKIPGLLTALEAAAKWNTGQYSVYAAYKNKQIRGVWIGDELYIYDGQENPFETRVK